MRDLPAIGAAPVPDRATRSITGLRDAFARTMGVLLLAGALVVWASVVGIVGTGAMPPLLLWSLAALLPVAGQGMWLRQPWGRVLWLVCVALHVAAIAGGFIAPGWAALALVFHATTVGLFLLLEAAYLVDKRRTR